LFKGRSTEVPQVPIKQYGQRKKFGTSEHKFYKQFENTTTGVM